MNIWNQSPLVKAFLPFLLGILCAIYFGTGTPFYILIATLPFLIWTALQILFPDKFVIYGSRWTTGTGIFAIFFCCGYSLCIIRSEINDARHFSKINNADAFVAVVNDLPIEKENSYKTIVEITSVKEGDIWKRTMGNCLLYLKKDSLAGIIKYGDEIVFETAPQEVAGPANPSQFNYKRFLSYRNISQQVYLKDNDWKLIDHHKANVLIEAALNLRARLMGVFKDNKIEGQDYAVLSALTLGDEGEVDQSTMNAFAASGTLHILSVSGMHVGIIFVVINGSLFFMNRKRSTRIIKSIILIFFLASYALLTGLSPPVLRSAAMLGLIVLGIALERQKNSWNTIAASLIILLCWNPYYLMDVGFQLSYISVIGIIFLYEKIFNWVEVHDWLLRQIWKITSASLSAQLATFPLCLFYFHQFPNYFILSNLIIIPLSEAIIYGGMALLMVAKWSSFALIIGKAVGWCVHALNWAVLWIEHLPYSQMNKISVSGIETFLLYAAILLFILFFLKRKQRLLLASIVVFCAIIIFQTFQTIETRTQKQLVVFDIPKTSAINFIEGKQSFLLADTLLTNSQSKMQFSIRPYSIDKGIVDEVLLKKVSAKSIIQNASLFMQNNFIAFHEKKIVIVNDRSIFGYKAENKIKVDYLVLSKNAKVNIDELLALFDPQQIIFDSSNSRYQCDKWQKQCKKAGIKFHNVQEEGALIVNV